MLGREDGPPPPVDLAHEKRVGDFVRGLIATALVTAVHDLSDGGLAVALAEMAMASGIGATVNQLNDVDPSRSSSARIRAAISLTAPESDLGRAVASAPRAAAVFLPWIGNTGGHALEARRCSCRSRSRTSAQRHEGWFPRFMGGLISAAGVSCILRRQPH